MWGEIKMKKKKFDDYYSFLKEQVGAYHGKFDDIIYHVPEIFKILTELLNDDIDNKTRLIINAALAYFVAPMDIIPEQIYGPYGYIDDLFICSYVLKKIQNEYGWGILRRNWYGVGDIKIILPKIYKKSKEAIKGKEKDILKYVGLK